MTESVELRKFSIEPNDQLPETYRCGICGNQNTTKDTTAISWWDRSGVVAESIVPAYRCQRLSCQTFTLHHLTVIAVQTRIDEVIGPIGLNGSGAAKKRSIQDWFEKTSQ